MNILSWKVLLFLKKEAVNNTGYTRAGVAAAMGISSIGLLRILRMLVKKGEIRCLQQRNRPMLYMSLKEVRDVG